MSTFIKLHPQNIHSLLYINYNSIKLLKKKSTYIQLNNSKMIDFVWRSDFCSSTLKIQWCILPPALHLHKPCNLDYAFTRVGFPVKETLSNTTPTPFQNNDLLKMLVSLLVQVSGYIIYSSGIDLPLHTTPEARLQAPRLVHSQPEAKETCQKVNRWVFGQPNSLAV